LGKSHGNWSKAALRKLMTNLINIRWVKGITYQDIERATGIPPARMRMLESGEAHITIDELEKLLKYYNVTYDQAKRFRKKAGTLRKTLPAALAVAFAIAVCFAFYFTAGRDAGKLPSDGMLAADGGHPSGGDILEPAQSVGDGENTAKTGTGGEEVDAPGTEAGTGENGEASSETAHETGSAETGTVAGAPAEAEGQSEAERVVFRFWGNIPYHAAAIPKAKDRSDARTIDVFPVQYLDTARPDWLEGRDKKQFILNAGTTEVWTPTTIEAYQSLKADDFQVIGLGKLPEVYEPLVIEVNGKKVGFMPLTGLIRNSGEAALKSRAGLPGAYRRDEVVQAVREAKEKADFLFVLIDWGKRRSLKPNAAQKLIAQAIVDGGGDVVIGNRPIHPQDMAAIGGKPVFYALGHSVLSENTAENDYHFIVEAEFSTQLDNITVIVGKMAEGAINFELTEEDKSAVREAFGDKAKLTERVEIVW